MPPAVTESLLLMGFTFVVNLPFGYWREGTVKFSPAWFAAVHAAVPLIILLRYALELEWRWAALPFTVAAYFAGQAVGARRRRATASESAADQA
jgi:hypothetical protein